MTSNTCLETGVEAIDRRLGGGVPVGSVVAVTAPPSSQSELLLSQIVTGRDAVYHPTVRPATTVERAFARRESPHEVDVRRLDDDTPLQDLRASVSAFPAETNVVVDPVGVLEECPPASYRRLLADLAEWAEEADGLVVFHCLRDEHTPARRRDTLHAADLVFDLTSEVRGDSVVTTLSVPKFRDGRAMTDVVKLDLTTEVAVDMSRTII